MIRVYRNPERPALPAYTDKRAQQCRDRENLVGHARRGQSNEPEYIASAIVALRVTQLAQQTEQNEKYRHGQPDHQHADQGCAPDIAINQLNHIQLFPTIRPWRLSQARAAMKTSRCTHHKPSAGGKSPFAIQERHI